MQSGPGESECPVSTQRYGNGPRLQFAWRSGCPPIMMEWRGFRCGASSPA